MSVEFEELKKLRENPADEANNMVEFSDEEGYGKYRKFNIMVVLLALIVAFSKLQIHCIY